jgi:Catalase
MSDANDWTETYDGGSVEAERAIFVSLAERMLAVQEMNRQKTEAPCPVRTLHAKLVAGITNASLTIDPELPQDFHVSYFQRGATLPAIVRFSNASGIAQHDSIPDMRGAALRVALPDGGIHDLLMTSFPVSHARNARQFVEFAVLAAGNRETLPQRLVEAFGLEEAQRMGANIRQGVRPCLSLALEGFWSRGAVLWGKRPVRFALRPFNDASTGPATLPDLPDGLRIELARRLKVAPIQFRLTLQRFVDETVTPIEDGAIEWLEETSPAIEVATLMIPLQDLLGEVGREQAAQVDRLAFNPWNAPPEFRPLGNLNRARGVVYGMSTEAWQRHQKTSGFTAI